MKTPTQSRPSRGFTLIELLVVITIIAVLAGAGFVVGNSALNNARKLASQASAMSIQKAIDAFYSEYGTFPVTGSVDRIDTSSSPEILNALLGKDETLNPRGLPFLTAKEGKKRGSGGADGLVFSDDGSVRGMYDSWGNGFIIILNSNFEDQLRFTTSDSKSVTLNGRNAAVFSPGVPEGETATTKTLVKSW
jgi:prepilin-type N-terminal cleavage/methylation domain-containing protein